MCEKMGRVRLDVLRSEFCVYEGEGDGEGEGEGDGEGEGEGDGEGEGEGDGEGEGEGDGEGEGEGDGEGEGEGEGEFTDGRVLKAYLLPVSILPKDLSR